MDVVSAAALSITGYLPPSIYSVEHWSNLRAKRGRRTVKRRPGIERALLSLLPPLERISRPLLRLQVRSRSG